MPARSSAALITMPPSPAALKPLSEPSSRPIAVLAPPTITGSLMAATIRQVRAAAMPRRDGRSAVLTRIDHVGIACRDVEAATAFCEATFGLTVVSRETNSEQGVREAILVFSDAPAGA